MVDFLIVGAGFSGCVLAERVATQLDKTVLIVEKRNHIGGNAFDYYDENGILIHKYGPHWFHTNSKKVFSYLSKFTEWRYHYHRVLACVDGLFVPLPPNLDTFRILSSADFDSSTDLFQSLTANFMASSSLDSLHEIGKSIFGNLIYEKIFRGYTEKQWGEYTSQLDRSVISRLSFNYNKDSRYFKDKYQCMPKHGYTRMFERMLSHKNIKILLQTDYKEILDSVAFDKLIYTGPADEFFDCSFGRLPYRSLRFEHETFDTEFYQPVQQVNYPNEYDFTRIVEWKHATGQTHNKTTITREYPKEAEKDDEKFYPIPTEETSVLYEKYKTEASKLKSVIFCGRLAEYRYYNMDQVVAKALHIFENDIAKKR